MLGSGKSSGVINEATNLKANQNLTDAVKEMGTKAYQKTRDLSDVVPTHRHELTQPKKVESNLKVFDPEADKEELRRERQEEAADDEDDDLIFLRERRLAALKQQQLKEQEWRGKQHGSYREISQDDFFNTVVRDKGGSDDVCVHFYHKDFEKCKVMDSRLQDLCQTFLSVKFVRMDVEKSPFLVEKLKVSMLPALILFHNDIACDRIIGFDEIGSSDDVDINKLRARIEEGLKMNRE
jgi:hypothetical protein